MAGADTVELRAVLSLDILVLQPVCEPVIRGVRELPPDMEKLRYNNADEWPLISGGMVCT